MADNKNKLIDLIDFNQVNILLEGFKKSTGFLTAILDLEGNVLSKSGWRNICTEFHRVNPETSKKCLISDTVLANKMAEGKEYHCYKCLNGLVDVAVPLVIKGEHIANIFTGQFFYEKPDTSVFIEQAKRYGFNERKYIDALNNVAIVSEEKVKNIMTFLYEMTKMIANISLQKIEQVELNKALKNSEEHFRTIINQAGDAMYLCNFEGEIKMVNKHSCEMLGYSQKELLQKKVGDLDVNYIDPDLQKELWNKLENHKPQTLTSTHKRKDGKHIPVEIRFSLIDFNEQKAILGFVRNISERKEAELQLQESEEKFKSLMHQSPFAMELYNMNGLQTDVNKAYEELWKFPAETTINKFNVLKSKEVKDSGLLEYVKRAYSGESVDVPEYQFDPKGDTEARGEGRVRWLSTRIYPIKDEHDKVYNIVIVHRDVSDRKLTEILLKNRNAYIESIMDNMPIGFAVNTIDDGDVKYMNKLFEEIYGWPRDVLTNTSVFFDKVFPNLEYRERMKTQIIADMQSGNPKRMQWKDLKIVTNSGEKRFVHAFNIPLLDQNLMISTVQDNTKRKLAEDEIEKHRINLEELIKERTIELESKNADLERMNKLFVGRELRMKELKQQIKLLQDQSKKS